MNKYIVGLDIGTTKIACFIGERAENGKIRILGFGKTESVGVERGVVRNIRSTADSIRRAVTDASEMAKCDVSEVYVGIAGQYIKSRANQGQVMIPEGHRVIEQEDVDRLIEDQKRILLEPGEEIIHIFPQKFIVDNEELAPDIPPVGVGGKCLMAQFHIVTCNTANLHNIRDAVEDAGYIIKGVVLEPIASGFAVLDDRDQDAGVALVDIGGGTTDIAIFQEGIIRHTRVLPLAGNVITNDIKENCKILKHQAESLKTRFGSCVPASVNQDDIIAIPGIRNQAPREISVKTLAGIIKARVQTILEQVAYELQLSGYDNSLIAGVVLTGGGARMKNIKEFSEFVIGIDSRIGLPNEHIDEQGSVSFDDFSHPMYATGIGLVIYGLSEEERLSRPAAPAPEPEPEPEPIPEPEPVDTREPADPDSGKKPGKGKKDKTPKNGPDKERFIDAVNKFLRNAFTDECEE